MNYKLYLVLPQAIPEGAEFYLITGKYCLLYTNGEAPDGAKEITRISTLPELAKRWLGGCIDELRVRALAQQKDNLLSEIGPMFHDALRNALESEKQRAEGGETGDADSSLSLE